MEDIINKMLEKADETSRNFTDGLSNKAIRESLGSVYFSVAEEEGMNPIQAKEFSKFLIEKFGTKEPSNKVMHEWAIRFKESKENSEYGLEMKGMLSRKKLLKESFLMIKILKKRKLRS